MGLDDVNDSSTLIMTWEYMISEIETPLMNYFIHNKALKNQQNKTKSKDMHIESL